MPRAIAEEIRQARPFHNPEEEAFLTLVRTADALVRQVDQLLKPHGLTMTQYNALRILRGAGAREVNCSYVAERLVTTDPDVTRLFDRMERAGLVERTRGTEDRRQVLSRISRSGIRLLAKLDTELDALHVRQFAALSPRLLSSFVQQLDKIREAAATPLAIQNAKGRAR